MAQARPTKFLWLGALLVTVVLPGCGRREYNRLTSSRIALARGEAKFRTLYAPTDIPGTPLRIRIPLIFKPDQLFIATSKHGEDGNQIRADRLQPPFMKWSGFKHCYEGHAAADDGRSLPFYCYLGAVPGTSADAEKLQSQLAASLKETFKDAELDWQIIDCESPTGIAVQWRKLRIEADQPFLIKGAGGVAAENLPGIFEVWVAEKQNHIVVMAWRVPKAIDAPASAAAPAPAPTASGIEALAAVQSGGTKPDTNSMPTLMGGTLTVNPAAAEPAGG